MGVKDLWSVLSPVCEKKSLWELEGTSIAIDLSAWICDSNSICSPQINMYLRNLFFRTSYLLLLGVRPVFVLEGDAPELKADAIRKRMQLRAGNTDKVIKETDVNRACSRNRLKGLQKQCVELLSHMGLECVKARGEAEALCAHLNALGVVSGVVTQDSDVFLYGAREVYRNFQLAPHYTCDAYRSDVIQDKLGLSRTKLIGFSILAGSDYNEGVSKIGKATILKYLNSVQDKQVFQKFIEWRNNCYFDRVSENKFMTSDMRLEFSIREKALKDDGFPYLDVIAEYTADPQRLAFEYKWSKPSLAKFVAFAVKKLAWEDEYAAKKFLPILGRWHLSNGGHPCDFSVVSIIGNGQGRNASKYRVAWNQYDIVTAESKELVVQCYSHLVDAFEESRQKKKKPKGTGRGRKKKTTEETAPAVPIGKQPSLDQYFSRLPEPPEFELPQLELDPSFFDCESSRTGKEPSRSFKDPSRVVKEQLFDKAPPHSVKEPSLSVKGPSRVVKEHSLFNKAPPHPVKEQLFDKAPPHSVKEPSRFVKDPSQVVKEHSLFNKAPPHPVKEPSRVVKEHSLFDKAPPHPVKEPSLSVKGPSRVVKEHSPFDKAPPHPVKEPSLASVQFPTCSKGILDDSSFDETLLSSCLRSPQTPSRYRFEVKPPKMAKVDQNASIISIEDDDLHDISLAIESIVSCPQSNPALLL